MNLWSKFSSICDKSFSLMFAPEKSPNPILRRCASIVQKFLQEVQVAASLREDFLKNFIAGIIKNNI